MFKKRNVDNLENYEKRTLQDLGHFFKLRIKYLCVLVIKKDISESRLNKLSENINNNIKHQNKLKIK